MARGFRIHSGAVFNPFTLKELREPIQEYNQAYSQMQDYMLAAGEEANQYKQLVDNDEYASGILRGYNSTLSDISGQLSREGLKAINKGTILGLRKKYNEEVKPVNDAAKTLAGLQETYRQMYAKDPTTMRGAMPTIKELIDNPAATPIITSGTSLYNQGVNAAKAASQRKQDFKVRLNGIVRGYIDTVQTSGYNSAEAQMFLNEASRQPELQEIFNQIYNANSVSGLEDPSRGSEWILRGILDGMVYDQKTDLKYDQYGAEMRAVARAAAKDTPTGNAYINRRTVTAQKPLTKEAKEIEKYLENFDFDQSSGKFVMNEKGKKAYDRALVGNSPGVLYGAGYRTNPEQANNPFKTFLDGLTPAYKGGGRGDKYSVAADAFTRYYTEHQNELKNASQFKEYDFNLSGTENKVLENFLKTTEGDLQIMKRNNDGKLVVDKDTKAKNLTKDSSFMVNGMFLHPDGNMYIKTTQGLIMLPTLNEDAQLSMSNIRMNMTELEDNITEYMEKLGVPSDMALNPTVVQQIVDALMGDGKTQAALRLQQDYNAYVHNMNSMGYFVADIVRTLGAKEAQF